MKFFYDRFFPIVKKDDKRFKHRVVVGIGGNKGDVRKRFRNLYMYFNKSSRVSVYKTSAILQNPPFGYLDQDDFYNGVIILKTSLAPKALLKFLLHVEKIFGRKRSFKNAPRTLDLDIIFFNTIKYSQKNLEIPHPRWFKRDSVVLPLENLRELKKRIM
jgi:2-amino-4-hydroxy-6-hydroxymethyldihydropteridine diphosphokinase